MRSRPNTIGLRVTAVIAATITALALGATMAAAAVYTPVPTASWSPTSGTVYAMARAGNTIVIGGSFTALRSPDDRTTSSRNRLAAIDATTGALLSWNPGANGEVRALEASADGQSVYAGGAFTQAGGRAVSRLAQISLSSGSASASFAVTANSTVFALKRIGSTLYAGGAFTSLNGRTQQHLSSLSASTGAVNTSFTGSANNTVYALQDSSSSGNLLVGGRFTTLSGSSRAYLGEMSQSSGAPTSWTPGVCTGAGSSNLCYVYGIVRDASTVYVGAGGSGGRVVALNSSGARRWTGYADGDVQAIAISGTTIVAGGHFYEQFNGEPRAGLVELNASSGALVSTFAPQIGQGLGVFAIIAGSGRMWIGGGFDHVDQTTEMRFTSFAPI